MYKYITDFVPWGKTYFFKFDKYNCYYKRTRKCSLNNMDIPCDINEYEKWQKEFCQNLASSIIQNGFYQAATDVIVIRNNCGHYSVDEGQHRICVCARLRVPMKVVLLESQTQCKICSTNEKSVLKRISYKLGMKDEILISF